MDNTIEQLRLRNISGANIVGLKKEDGFYIFNPPPDFRISSKYQLFVLGTPNQIEKLKNVLMNNHEKK
jgi:voltage-gated potassium channel